MSDASFPRSTARPQPLGSIGAPARRVAAEPREVDFAQLYFSLLSALGDGAKPFVQFTGVDPGVGTSFVLRQVAAAARRVGGLVETSDLSAADGAGTLALTDPPALLGERASDAQAGGSRGSALVLVDTAPISRSVASLDLARRVGGTVLVVEAEQSTRRAIEAALEQIETCGGRCLGLVLNHRRARSIL